MIKSLWARASLRTWPVFLLSHRRTLSVALLVAALAGVGCGDAATSGEPPAPRAVVRTVADAPVYRAGQFCETANEARYRKFHFTCRGHHLHGR